jgi:hypothetical protein
VNKLLREVGRWEWTGPQITRALWRVDGQWGWFTWGEALEDSAALSMGRGGDLVEVELLGVYGWCHFAWVDHQGGALFVDGQSSPPPSKYSCPEAKRVRLMREHHRQSHPDQIEVHG